MLGLPNGYIGYPYEKYFSKIVINPFEDVPREHLAKNKT